MHRHRQFSRFVYAASFFFGLQGALAAYVNSTYLSNFVPETWIGIVYGAANALAMCLLFLAPPFIKKIGNRKIVLAFLVVSFLSLFALAHGNSAKCTLVAFVLYIATNAAIFYSFDMFIEHINPDHGTTGRIRGFYLLMVNLAWMAAPLVTGFIVATYGFTALYGLSMVFVVLTFLMIGPRMDHCKEPAYRTVSLAAGLRSIFAHKDLRNIAAVNFTLQLFYSWMIVFMPVYLVKQLGFSWESIGIMFTIMLVPFVILQYPLGRLADAYLGEKELLIGGLLVMGLATIVIPTFAALGLIAWAALLFMTRMGAATIEAMAEIYFFKQIAERDVSIVSAYRFVAPTAFIVGPIVGGIIIGFASYEALFATLGGIVLFGIYWAVKLKDTK